MFYIYLLFFRSVTVHKREYYFAQHTFSHTESQNSPFLDLYHENNYLLKKHLASSCYQLKKNYLCNVVVKPIGKKRKTFRY